MDKIVYDDDSEIVEIRTYEFLGKLFVSAIKKNGDGSMILKKSGLSSLCGQYECYIDPYSYNGQWENKNVQFDAVNVFIEIFTKIDDKHKFLFIKNIIEKDVVDYNNKEIVDNHLSILGYSLIDDIDNFPEYSIIQTRRGLIERGSDIVLLEETISSDFPELKRFYNEALSTFGNGEYKSCIDNCRSLYEKIVQSITGLNTDRSILSITKEQVLDLEGNQIVSKDKIYQHWIKNRKGANRYRYFTTLYSIMSGLGPHGEDIATKADAVLILRAMEDSLVWMLEI